jgi:hypothetical protein
MQENKFFVFKKSMRKHIFKTSNIFCIYKKSIQNMLGYWPYAAHKKTFFLYFFVQTQTSSKIFTYSKIRKKLKTISLK